MQEEISRRLWERGEGEGEVTGMTTKVPDHVLTLQFHDKYVNKLGWVDEQMVCFSVDAQTIIPLTNP